MIHHITAKTINKIEAATNELKEEINRDLIETKEPSKAEAYDMLMKAFGSGKMLFHVNYGEDEY